MPFISLSKLLRFNLYYWCAIFGLGLLSSWQNALIHVKEFEWRYLPTMLASEMVAMLLTAMVVVWSYRRIQQQFFANWQLLAGVALVALIYIPAENAFWMVLWDKDIIDMRMLIGNLDTSVLAFFVWAAGFLSFSRYCQQQAQAQDNALASYAEKLHKDEALLDFSKSADALQREIRAFNPWPVSYLSLPQGNIKIWQAHSVKANGGQPAGTVLTADKQGIAIACAEGVLVITQLQPPGKKAMAAADFLNGRADWLSPGTLIGQSK